MYGRKYKKDWVLRKLPLLIIYFEQLNFLFIFYWYSFFFFFDDVLV